MIAAAKTTEDILKEMLTENTGSHMLDSGGAYGRNWSRNKGRDFDKEPATVLNFEFGEMEITHNIYHWLNERLDYEAEIDTDLHGYANLTENKEKAWEDIMEEFLKHLCAEKDILFSPHMVMACNTYNSEDLLSQVMQYFYIEEFDDPLIFLRIHGGCDVRGGYTAPRVFTGDMYEYAIMDNAKAYLYCKDNSDHNWFTDDAYTFYNQDDTGKLSDFQFRTMKDVLESGETVVRQKMKNLDLFEEGETKRVHYSHVGTLIADEERNVGHCPKCGGVLAASS